MSLAMIGRWGNPLNPAQYGDLVERAVKRSNCRCGFCGVQMPQTASHPYAGLFVCVAQKGSAPELSNVITLCAVCVRFNDLNNLKNCGQFVELPWISQGRLTNMLRILYCAQNSQDDYVQKSVTYQGSNAILQTLSRVPAQWDEYDFDGNPEMVIEAARSYGGLPENPKKQIRYLDRLRLFWTAEAFAGAIEFWTPTIEAQIINYEYGGNNDPFGQEATQ